MNVLDLVSKGLPPDSSFDVLCLVYYKSVEELSLFAKKIGLKIIHVAEEGTFLPDVVSTEEEVKTVNLETGPCAFLRMREATLELIFPSRRKLSPEEYNRQVNAALRRSGESERRPPIPPGPGTHSVAKSRRR